MAEAMKLDLVSPERKLASMDATMIQIPGTDGDMTAMYNHTPTVVTLRPGILRVVTAGGAIEEFVVAGGFAEISPNSVSVLAERAVVKAEANANFLDGEIKLAQDFLAATGDDAAKKAAAELALNDLQNLKSHLST